MPGQNGSSVAPTAAAATARATGSDASEGEARLGALADAGCCVLRPRLARRRLPERRAEIGGERGGARPGPGWRASAPSTAETSRRGRSGRSVTSGGAPASIALATSWSGTPQNGCLPASDSQRRTPTDQTSLSGVASSPARRSGAMYASVPGTSPTAVSVSAPSNCASPKSSRRAAISSLVLEEDVRRLDVAMDDARAVRMRQGVEHLGRDLDGIGVGELVHPHRLAQRASGDVLVRDVHVARVVPDVVGAHAAVMAEPSRREGLALGSGRGLPLARDDLQRDGEAGPLVLREPDGAGAAAPERTDRPVAAEDELSGRGDRDGRHRYRPLGCSAGKSFGGTAGVSAARATSRNRRDDRAGGGLCPPGGETRRALSPTQRRGSWGNHGVPPRFRSALAAVSPPMRSCASSRVAAWDGWLDDDA